MSQTNATSDGQPAFNVTTEVCAGKYGTYKFSADKREFLLLF